MIAYGSLMSQALQCTQLAALICRRFSPSVSTSSYTPAGQKRSQGLPYSTVHRSMQMLVSCTLRCAGWFSSCEVAAKYTEASLSFGGSSRGPSACGTSPDSLIFSNFFQSASPCFSVHGERPPVSVSKAALASPNHNPFLKPGAMLRTLCNSLAESEARQAASKPSPVPLVAT